MDTNHDGVISKDEFFHGLLVHRAHGEDEHKKEVEAWNRHLEGRKEVQRAALGISIGLVLFAGGILLGSTRTGRSLVSGVFERFSRKPATKPIDRHES